MTNYSLKARIRLQILWLPQLHCSIRTPRNQYVQPLNLCVYHALHVALVALAHRSYLVMVAGLELDQLGVFAPINEELLLHVLFLPVAHLSVGETHEQELILRSVNKGRNKDLNSFRKAVLQYMKEMRKNSGK